MTVEPTIDTSLTFIDDAGGRDSDRHSPTLQAYHRRLWSKALPGDGEFELTSVRERSSYLLLFRRAGADLLLSSDILANSSRRPCARFYEQVPEEVRKHFHAVGLTIGGRLIFPAQQVGGAQTINQRRGTHPLIKDRFDLTLECIRRHYAGEPSPLTDVLAVQAQFFDLFTDFRGYVDFFLLDDLVEDDPSKVKFYLPFAGFEGSPLPKALDLYRQFLDRQVEFVVARNSRILRAVGQA